MENAHWPGCDGITGRRTTRGLSVAGRGGEGRGGGKASGEEEGDCARLPTPKGSPYEASKELEEEVGFFSPFGR